jgi:hypothetical protein
METAWDGGSVTGFGWQRTLLISVATAGAESMAKSPTLLYCSSFLDLDLAGENCRLLGVHQPEVFKETATAWKREMTNKTSSLWPKTDQ